MTHADRVREAKECVLNDACAWSSTDSTENVKCLRDACDELLSLERETCPTCGGTGEKPIDYWTEMGVPGERYVKCPAGCEQGRKR